MRQLYNVFAGTDEVMCVFFGDYFIPELSTQKEKVLLLDLRCQKPGVYLVSLYL